MNSIDPWSLIVTDAEGDIIIPRPRYGHPFYSEVPSWIHYGDNDSTTRQLFDGAFISGELSAKGQHMSATYYYPYGFVGADVPPVPVPTELPRRTGLTAELAPIVAPATGGITVKKHLDDKQVLHVEICVDGKCHATSMDLAPAISMLMQKLSQWHAAQHATVPPPSTVVSTVESAVGCAQDAIVGALVARHVDTVCGSFLGDITGAAKGALKGVTGGLSSGLSGLTGGLRSTFGKLKGPIGAAASIAAAAGASAIPGVGPIAAPIASKLANDLVNAAAGDTKAKQAVAQANQQAQTNPAVAVALDQATKAVATATAAHHVQDTAKKAAQGDSAAQQQIVQVADDAQKGDPAAKVVADLVANAMKSQWGAKLWEQVTERGPATVSGAAIASPILIPVLDEDGRATRRQVMWHPTHDQIKQFGAKQPSYYTEDEGGPFLFDDPSASRGYKAYRPTWTVRFWSEGAAVSSGWYDIVGAALDDVREKARAHAVTKPGNAAGVLITVDGRLHGRGFRNLDDAIDWLQHITRNRGSFTYAAAFEKDSAGNAYIQDEEIGSASQAAPMQGSIPRAAPATTGWWY